MASRSTERGSVRRRLVCGLGVVVGAVALAASPASAHAVVDEIAPADGSVLPAAPAEVVVDFSEAVLLDFVDVDVVASDGSTVEVIDAYLDIDDESVLHLVVPELGDAVYEVTVSTRDRADLHEVTARTGFGVGTAAPPPAPPARAPAEPYEAGARWIFAIGLALMCGALVVRSRWPEMPIARPDAVRRSAAAGIALVVVGRLGVIVARAVDLDAGWRRAWDTTLGTGDVRRLPFVLLALACVAPIAVRTVPVWLDVPYRQGSTVTVRVALAGIGVVWVAVLAAWGDHSALAGSVEPTVAFAKALHLLGLGLWIGSLVVAGLANRRSRSLRAGWSAVSSVAIVGACVAVASGIVLMGRLVVSLTALLSTSFGLLLVGKFALLATAAVLGARAARPSPGAVRARRLETLALGLVVAAGATMATAGPAIEQSFVASPDAPPPTESSVVVDDLLVQVQPIPGRPGPNTVQVRVYDTRRPAPAEFASVDVVTPSGVSSSAPIVDGVAFVDAVDLPSGATPIEVVVHRVDWPEVVAGAVVSTNTPVYRAPVRVSARPIGPTTTTVGWVLLAVLLATAGRALRRRATPDVTAHGREEERWVHRTVG